LTRLELRLLGGFRAIVDGSPVAADSWATRRSSELVQLLALARDRRLHRDEVLEALWPRLDPEAGAANLYKAASHARKGLGDTAAVVLRGASVWLAPEAEVTVDVDRYEAEARTALETGDAVRCANAALLYDDLLPEARYEDWVIVVRGRLRALQLELLRKAALWEQVLALDPLDQQAHRALMRRYAETGNRLAALFQFGHLRELLRRELGLEPDPETVDLYREFALGPPSPPPFVPPPIRYVRSGEVSIAYQVVGEGPPDLLMIPGWISHLALDWEEPTWVDWCERMTSFARLIRFDKRGTGLSDRPPGVSTLEERMEDARAVLDDVAIDSAHVMGWSEGGPLGILLAATHPEAVRSLVLYGTQARFERDVDYPWGSTAEQNAAEIDSIRGEWGTEGSADFLAPRGDRRFAQQFEAYMRAGASPSAAAALQAANVRIDVRPLLARISVPTLVLSRRGDPIGPPAAARYMAERIRGARFVELDGDDHVMWVGDIDTLLGEIEAFVAAVESRAVDRRKVLGSPAS
jgi:DNA-binding SARP family transcriptional activator/pimeloyl-ACP methyl ester carboxylesterase